MSKAWAGGGSRKWRTIRAQILMRDKYLCQIKLPAWGTKSNQRCQVNADTVHHILGRAVTGDDPQYLQAACTPCNLRIGDPAKSKEPKPTPLSKW